MDCLSSCAAATTAVTTSISVNKFSLFPPVAFSSARLNRTSKRVSFRVFAEKEEPKLDKWDQMELKFGRLLGEDPKLTIAKIMGRKANPEASYMEIEKAFHKNKGKIVEIKEVPFDFGKKPSTKSSYGLNLVRPVPKKGIKFETDNKPTLPEIKRPTLSGGMAMDSEKKSKVPNVILRKPTVVNEDDVEDMPSRTRFRMKSNLSLKMRNQNAKERFTDMSLLRKPEPVIVDTSLDEKQDSNDGVRLEKEKEVEDKIGDFTLLEKPEQVSASTKIDDEDAQIEDLEVDGGRSEADIEANMPANATKISAGEALEAGYSSVPRKPEIVIGMQSAEQSNRVSTEEFGIGLSVEAALQGKPKRLDQSIKETSNSDKAETVPTNYEDYVDLPSVSPQEVTLSYYRTFLEHHFRCLIILGISYNCRIVIGPG